jgi:hypothetical protein
MYEDANGNQIPKNLTKLICAKYREGELWEADLRFIGRLKQFDTMPAYDDGQDLPSIPNPFKNIKPTEFNLDEDNEPGF